MRRSRVQKCKGERGRAARGAGVRGRGVRLARPRMTGPVIPTGAAEPRGGGGWRLAVGSGRETGGCDVIASLPEAEGTPPILDTLDSML
jgi:hypothetical protein